MPIQDRRATKNSYHRVSGFHLFKPQHKAFVILGSLSLDDPDPKAIIFYVYDNHDQHHEPNVLFHMLQVYPRH